MATFGNTTIGSVNDGSYAGYARCWQFALSEAGTINSITAYVTGNNMRAFILDANGNVVSVSQEVNVAGTPGWNIFPINPGVTLPAGTYYLGIQSDVNYAFVQLSGSDYSNYYFSNVYGTFPASVPMPLGSVGSSGAPSIYATYTPSSTPPPLGNWTLNISTTTGGTVSPAGPLTGSPGTATPSIQAAANPNSQFAYWLQDGATQSTINPIAYTINDSVTHTLQAVFTATTPPPPTGPLLFKPCTSLNEAFQGNAGSWLSMGSAPNAESVIVADGAVLPDGSIAKSYANGTCTRLMAGFLTDGVTRQCCNFYASWIRSALNWDLSKNQLVKIPVFVSNPNMAITIGAVDQNWSPIMTTTINPGAYSAKQWIVISVDLRDMGASPATLQQVQAIVIYASPIGDQNTNYILTSQWTVEPATGPTPLGGSLSPTNAAIQPGQTQVFTVAAWGATPPYTIKWVLNGQIVATGTIPVVSGTTSYTLIGQALGTSTLNAVITESGGQNLTTNSASILTYPIPLPRNPARPLHVSGTKILDDANTPVSFYGVCIHGFEDSPYGHTVDLQGNIHWNTWSITDWRNMLDALIRWGVNVIRLHCNVATWLGNYGNMITNFKTLFTECAQRGIYVVLEFFDLGYYGMFSEPEGIPWQPTNPTWGPVTDVTGYSSIQFATLQSMMPDANAFAIFWGNIANQLKNYSNVIFELWNEPNGDATAMNTFFAGAQLAINAIRATGAPQIIEIQWGYGVAYTQGQVPNPYGIQYWVPSALALNDPAKNIMLSTHIYRKYNGLGTFGPDNHYGTTIAEITEALTSEGILTNWGVPLYCGEIGANMNATDFQNEITAFANLMGILIANGIYFSTWVWFPSIAGSEELLAGQPGYQPNTAGTQIITALQQLPPPPPPTPNITVAPGNATLGTGQQASFAASIIGGKPPYTINWIDNATGQTLGTGTTFTYTAITAGTFQIYAMVTDSLGATNKTTLIPITVTPTPPTTYTLQLNSNPTAATITLDGTPYTTPQILTLAAGPHNIQAAPTITVAGKTYNFTSWQDGTTNPTQTLQLSANGSVTANYTATPQIPKKTLTALGLLGIVSIGALVASRKKKG